MSGEPPAAGPVDEESDRPRPICSCPGHDEQHWTLTALAQLLRDLDRCDHGRHEGDSCFDCPQGTSTGNPRMPVGQRIGTTVHGRAIVMPPRGERHDRRSWTQPPPAG